MVLQHCLGALTVIWKPGLVLRNAVARQVAKELHSVTWVVSQLVFCCCAKRCTAKWKLSFTFCSGSQQLAEQYITPPATFLLIFSAVLTRVHAHTSRFLFQQGALGTRISLSNGKNIASCWDRIPVYYTQAQQLVTLHYSDCWGNCAGLALSTVSKSNSLPAPKLLFLGEFLHCDLKLLFI